MRARTGRLDWKRTSRSARARTCSTSCRASSAWSVRPRRSRSREIRVLARGADGRARPAGERWSAATGKPWLWQCTQIHNLEAQYRCYVRLLREDIDASGNPAKELPRIDRRVVAVGGPVEASCHVLMHQVGREFARDHRVTLASLQRYVPRSNNPNCSAGFGMGLVMYLGPEILRSGGKAAVRACAQLPTRYRSYTCVHGLGHALLRAYHGDIGQAVRACRALQHALRARLRAGCLPRLLDLSPRSRRDDEASRGDLTTRALRRAPDLREAVLVPLLPRAAGVVCRCGTRPTCAASCRGLHSIERFGCISAAALTISSNPFDQIRVCAQLQRGGCRGLPARRSRSGAGRKPGGAVATDPRLRPA